MLLFSVEEPCKHHVHILLTMPASFTSFERSVNMMQVKKLLSVRGDMQMCHFDSRKMRSLLCHRNMPAGPSGTASGDEVEEGIKGTLTEAQTEAGGCKRWKHKVELWKHPKACLFPSCPAEMT